MHQYERVDPNGQYGHVEPSDRYGHVALHEHPSVQCAPNVDDDQNDDHNCDGVDSVQLHS